jgi:hypothetical protein
MKKIIATIIFLVLLFLFSFALQSKYNTAILNSINLNTKGVDVLFLKQINLFGSSFRFMDLLTTSIIVCFAVATIILIFVLLNRNKMEKRIIIKNNLLVQYQKIILDAVEDKILTDEEIRKFKSIIKNQFNRQVFVQEMIDVALMLPKNTLKNLRKFYYDSGLIKATERKLKCHKWHYIIQGLKELSALDIKDYNDIVMKHINSKNDILRMEAQIAIVRLSNDVNTFEFLSKLNHNITLWEQITLHQLMVQADLNVPDFGKWVLSKNPSVVMFCLKMIREYNQIQNAKKIISLMHYDNVEVRKLTIEVIGDLKINESIDTLKDCYHLETHENSVEIVKTLGKLSNPNTIDFLQNIVDVNGDVQLQIESVKAIYNMGEIGKEYLEKMLNSEYKNYDIVIKHVLDNKIN